MSKMTRAIILYHLFEWVPVLSWLTLFFAHPGSFFGISGFSPLFKLFYPILLLSILFSILYLFFSARLVIAMSAARPVTIQEAPLLYSVMAEVATQSHPSAPQAFVIEDDASKVLLMGRPARLFGLPIPLGRGAVVVVTRGALIGMSRDQLTKVLRRKWGVLQSWEAGGGGG